MSRYDDDRIYQIEDIEELFGAVTKRRYWNNIRQEILRLIFNNAMTDIPRIRGFLEWNRAKRIHRFITISEFSNALQERFILFGKDMFERDAAGNFSAVLQTWGNSMGEQMGAIALGQNQYGITRGSQQHQLVIAHTEMALHSAVLCDPLALPVYISLAAYYGLTGQKDSLSDVFGEFDRLTQVLLATNDDQLSHGNIATKRNKESPECPNGLLSLIKQKMEVMKNDFGISE